MNINDRIRLARKHADLRQAAFAKLIGVKQQAVSKWENGISVPEIDNLSMIVKVCGVRYAWLIDGSGRMEQYSQRTQDLRDGFDRLPEGHKNSPEAFINTMAEPIDDCDGDGCKEANSG